MGNSRQYLIVILGLADTSKLVKVD